MLKQIILIKNIGKFLEVHPPAGNSEFQKLNIFYAENGSGKTTLSTILRSLCTGIPDYVLGKKSVFGNGEPEIEIRMEDNTIKKFRNSRWNETHSNLEIFDSKFIHENVFRGSTIELSHRRNLYQFIIGEQGVSLARRLIEIDEEIKEIGSREKQIEKNIKKHIVGNISFQDFLNASYQEDIENLIELKNQEVSSLELADELVRKPKPEKLVLPNINVEDIESILRKGIDDISEEAARNIAIHIHDCMDNKGESWIFKGLEYIRNENCPFCRKSIKGNDLVENFRLLFRESYKALKENIGQELNKYNDILSERNLRDIDKVINENLALLDFWRDHLNLDKPVISIEDLDSVARALRDQINRLLSQKQNSPAESVELDQPLFQAFQGYESFKEAVDLYNDIITTWCSSIDSKKLATSSANLESEKADLHRLLCSQKRHEAEISALCTEYFSLRDSKTSLQAEKADIRSRLDEYSTQVLSEHETSIRQHLEYFGAQFYPSQFQRDHSGGKPGFNFSIAINEVPIKLGNQNSPEDQPCFSNTLSEGDKQSLAFAFFLSKLEKDPQLHEKVVIFDDPICSLDSNRKTYTRQQIVHIAETAKQVFLLSHDPYFLRLVSENFPRNNTKLFKVQSHGTQASLIKLWDMASDTRSSYFNDFETLKSFLNGNTQADNKGVARCIRPLLEANLRIRFPENFGENEWLGQFIEKIRNTPREATDHPLANMLEKLDELCAVNDYSKKYHHDQNPGASSEPISPTELRVYVQRTLDLIR